MANRNYSDVSPEYNDVRGKEKVHQPSGEPKGPYAAEPKQVSKHIAESAPSGGLKAAPGKAP